LKKISLPYPKSIDADVHYHCLADEQQGVVIVSIPQE
jgi:hypothetical protein